MAATSCGRVSVMALSSSLAFPMACDRLSDTYRRGPRNSSHRAEELFRAVPLPGRCEFRRDSPRLAQAAFDRAVDEAAPQARVVARGEVHHARGLLQPGQITGQLAGPVCHPGGP